MDTACSKHQLIRPIALLAILMSAQLACSLMGGGSGESDKIPTLKAGETAKADGQDAQTGTTPQGATGGGSAAGLACFGTQGNGVTCLSADGWKTFTEENSDLETNFFSDMAACPDGKIYAGVSGGIAVFDGKGWQQFSIGDTYSSGDYLACEPDGGVWVGYYEGVSLFQNSEWEMHPSSEFDTSEFSGLVNGVAVTSDGTVWVSSSDSVAAFDGSSWKVYKQGSGFENEIAPRALAADADDHVYMLDLDGLYRFDGDQWTRTELGEYMYARSMDVDPQGRIWVSTVEKGAFMYDGSKWTRLSYALDGIIHSNGVYMAAFDKSGRTWLGMAYGVDVLMNGSWTHFRMDNADLTDNEIVALAVAGEGPALPAGLKKQTGSIRGSISHGGEKVTGADVELCVEILFGSFSGETPCSGQPVVKKTKTDAEGNFTITDLPVGYYILVVKVNDTWASSGFLGSDRVPVEEGKETYLGELMVKEE